MARISLDGVLGYGDRGQPNIADSASHQSQEIALKLFEKLGVGEDAVVEGASQAAQAFDSAIEHYLRAVFVEGAGGGASLHVDSRARLSRYRQFQHLRGRADLGTVEDQRLDFAIVTGSDPSSSPLLVASLDSYLTIRSDRASAVKLRKAEADKAARGRRPLFLVVTAEVLPTRLQSMVRGSSGISCIYHVALSELTSAIREVENLSEVTLLEELAAAHRIRDLDDLGSDLVAYASSEAEEGGSDDTPDRLELGFRQIVPEDDARDMRASLELLIQQATSVLDNGEFSDEPLLESQVAADRDALHGELMRSPDINAAVVVPHEQRLEAALAGKLQENSPAARLAKDLAGVPDVDPTAPEAARRKAGVIAEALAESGAKLPDGEESWRSWVHRRLGWTKEAGLDVATVAGSFLTVNELAQFLSISGPSAVIIGCVVAVLAATFRRIHSE